VRSTPKSTTPKNNSNNNDNDEGDDEGNATPHMSNINTSLPSNKNKKRTRSRSPRDNDNKASPTALSAVEQQTQLAQSEGSLQNCIMKGDYDLFFELLGNEEDPNETLMERDPVGATFLHWSCLMNHIPGSLQIANRIITEYPQRCCDMYTGDLYEGENCLHISIVNQNFQLAEKLVMVCPEQIAQHATGKFFAPGKHCYYGELPLSFAASTNQVEMIELLLQHGADMTNQDTANGNNCLHMAVLRDNIEVFDYLSSEWMKRKDTYSDRLFDSSFDCGFAGAHLLTEEEALTTSYSKVPLWRHMNKKGQSCLTLAAAEGSTKMFSHILDITKKLLWAYGPVTCICYPLAGFDTPLNSNSLFAKKAKAASSTVSYFSSSTNGQSPGLHIDRTNATESQQTFNAIKQELLQTAVEKSAIEEVVDRDRTDLMALKRVDDLVRRKWDAFAYRIFMRRLCLALLYIVLLFLATSLPRWEKWIIDNDTSSTSFGKPILISMNMMSPEWQQYPAQQRHARIARTIFELLLFVATIKKFQLEYEEVKQDGIYSHFMKSGAAVFENISSATCIFVVTLVFLSRIPVFEGYPIDRTNENAALSLCSLAAWINLLWFLLGWRSTGPFVIMLQKMVVSDMRTFCLIAAVFVGAFAQSFNLLRDKTETDPVFVNFQRSGNLTEALLQSDATDSSIYSSFSHDGIFSRVEELICAMLGEFDLQEYRSSSTHPYLATNFILIYVVLLSVVLVNMLVAKMGDTYAKISEQAELRWRLEVARMVLSMERSMSEEERKEESNKYWVIMDGGRRYLQVEEEDTEHWNKAAVLRQEKNQQHLLSGI